MVRRMQLFTQQTGDYPSFWGVNYNWFPALYGYVEGGVRPMPTRPIAIGPWTRRCVPPGSNR